MVDIYEYRKKIIEEIEKFAEDAGVESYEINNSIKQAKEDSAEFREWAGDKESWFSFIYGNDSIESINIAKETYFKVINSISKRKKEEELNKEKKNTEYWKESSDYWKNSSDFWKKNKYENPPTPGPQLPEKDDSPKKKSFDEETKEEYIEQTERKLKEKNISDAKLNQQLGVNDWKAEMNKSNSWRTAQTFSFSINDAIDKLSKQIVCDMCKETASPVLDYTEFDKKEGKKKKFCSWECRNAWRDKNKGVNKDDAKEIKKELQEIKDYLKKERVDANKMLNNLLAWMKKGGVINITLSDDKIVVELSGRKTKTIEESDLTSEQRVLKNYLQNNSGKKSINQSEIEKMISGNYNEERERNKKNGSRGIIAAIVVVGIVLVVVIGVVIHKNKRRDY